MTIPTGSLVEPDGADPLAAAAHWIEQATTGTIATVVATLAVAGIGFLMLSGHVPLRRGATIVGGCFVLFGAHAIAEGLMALSSAHGKPVRDVAPPVAAAPLPAVPPPQPQVYDPYAGASVPVG